MYPHTTNVFTNFETWEPSWVAWLAEAGYHCASIGKMHINPYDALGGFHQRFPVENKDRPLFLDEHPRAYYGRVGQGVARPRPDETVALQPLDKRSGGLQGGVGLFRLGNRRRHAPGRLHRQHGGLVAGRAAVRGALLPADRISGAAPALRPDPIGAGSLRRCRDPGAEGHGGRAGRSAAHARSSSPKHDALQHRFRRLARGADKGRDRQAAPLLRRQLLHDRRPCGPDHADAGAAGLSRERGRHLLLRPCGCARRSRSYPEMDHV